MYVYEGPLCNRSSHQRLIELTLSEHIESDHWSWPMLHITDGDSVGGTLMQTDLDGTLAIFGDLLYEGPAPANLTPTDFLEVRASFMAASGYAELNDARKHLQAFEETLSSISQHDETVLWFDHRLSDQLMLLKLLDWFHGNRAARSRLFAVPVPLSPRFTGFGHLSAIELTSLAGSRLPVSEVQIRSASAAWAAFTSPGPTAIEHVIERGAAHLSFLAAALRRHLEEFPSAKNGLSRTEHQALSILLRKGPLQARQLFALVAQTENPVFMGDLSFFRILSELASAATPLIQTLQRGESASGHTTAKLDATSTVMLSEAGLRVVQGAEDRVRLNGIDRWLGGVHLQGAESAWRWNRNSDSLVAS
jgi:hypothetical protein